VVVVAVVDGTDASCLTRLLAFLLPRSVSGRDVAMGAVVVVSGGVVVVDAEPDAAPAVDAYDLFPCPS
jgi:hypothetical protein